MKVVFPEKAEAMKTNKNCLPTPKSCLPVTESCLPATKICLPAARPAFLSPKSCLPRTQPNLSSPKFVFRGLRKVVSVKNCLPRLVPKLSSTLSSSARLWESAIAGAVRSPTAYRGEDPLDHVTVGLPLHFPMFPSRQEARRFPKMPPTASNHTTSQAEKP